MALQPPEKSFLQGLIQLTVALHHHQNANTAGAVSLLQRALRRFQLCPACYGGIDVASLSAETRAWIDALESGTCIVRPDVPRIQILDPAQDAAAQP